MTALSLLSGGAASLLVSAGLMVTPGATAAGAASLPTVSVGYADSATGIQPWGAISGVQGATATYFIGAPPSCCATHGPDNDSTGYDGGAIEIANTTGAALTVDSVNVSFPPGIYSVDGYATKTFNIWSSANASGLQLPLTLQPGNTLVLAQDGGPSNAFNFDTSDVVGEACDPNSTAVPVVAVTTTTGGVQTSTNYDDSLQVLASNGADLASCPHDVSEQHPFVTVQPGTQPLAAPVNTADSNGNVIVPVIESGANYRGPVESESVTASPGAFRASPPPSLSFQWLSCGGGSCAPATGPTGPTGLTYVPGPADVGRTLELAVTASNSQGTLTVDSAPSGTVTAGPALTQVGTTYSGLTAAEIGTNELNGTVYTAPTSGTVTDLKFFVRGAGNAQTYTPAVYTVNSNGTPGSLLATGAAVNVPIATDGNWYEATFSSSLTLTAGTRYLIGLEAGNQGGHGGGYLGFNPSGGSGYTAFLGSNPPPAGALGAATATTDSWAFYLDTTGSTASTAPTDATPPTIGGNPYIGSVLTAGTGAWNGTTPITYTYGWQRCNSAGTACAPISGANAASYTVVSGDVGSTLAVIVTATNSAGHASATSAPTPIVTTAPTLVTLGNTTTATTSSTAGAGYKWGSIFTTTSAGTTNDFRFYASGGTSVQSYVPFVYTVSGGQPATLLGTGPAISVAANQSPGWVTGPLTGIHLAAGTSYMIGLLAGPNSSQAADFYTTATSGAYWNANTGGYPTPTATWGAINVSNQSWNFAVDYTP